MVGFKKEQSTFELASKLISSSFGDLNGGSSEQKWIHPYLLFPSTAENEVKCPRREISYLTPASEVLHCAHCGPICLETSHRCVGDTINMIKP